MSRIPPDFDPAKNPAGTGLLPLRTNPPRLAKPAKYTSPRVLPPIPALPPPPPPPPGPPPPPVRGPNVPPPPVPADQIRQDLATLKSKMNNVTFPEAPAASPFPAPDVPVPAVPPTTEPPAPAPAEPAAVETSPPTTTPAPPPVGMPAPANEFPPAVQLQVPEPKKATFTSAVRETTVYTASLGCDPPEQWKWAPIDPLTRDAFWAALDQVKAGKLGLRMDSGNRKLMYYLGSDNSVVVVENISADRLANDIPTRITDLRSFFRGGSRTRRTRRRRQTKKH